MKRVVFTVFLGLLLWACNTDKDEPLPNDNDPVFDPTPYVIEEPFNFPQMVIPVDNPLTEEGILLGRKLFYDPILSEDYTQSCASCHAQIFGFTDNGKQFSEGIDGSIGTRNSMPIVNVGWMESLFWDGRVASVEEQALEPVSNPIEMHLQWTDAMERLNTHGEYPELFFAAFGTDTIDSIMVVKAIAQFERTMISGDSKWDQYLRGEVSLSQAESSGFEIFFTEAGDCFHCHATILFTDNDFHNNGLDSVFTDLGLQLVTGDPADAGKFKTPTLRNIEYTAPYMHDGRFASLEEVVNFYSEGLHWSPTIDPLMKNVDEGGVQLTEEQKQNLIAFLKTFSDETFITNPDFQDPSLTD